MSPIRVVFTKEVVDNLRDRRTVLTALMMPILGPIIVTALVYTLSQVAGGREGRTVTIPITGVNRAPNLVAYLEANGVFGFDGPADPEEAVRSGDEPIVLEIDETFGDALRSGRPARVRVVFDQTNRSKSALRRRIVGLIRQYDRQTTAQRLLVRGVHPRVLNAISVESVDVSTAERRGALVLGFLPMFIVLAVFLGGMYVAIDTTAGERERRSLDALLINPVPRWQLALGKLLATLVFTYITMIVAILGFVVVMRFIPPRTLAALDIEVAFSIRSATTVAVAMIPLSFFASTMQMLVATFCRSFKEAQAYVSIVMMLPILPALLLMGAPLEPETWMMLIPTLSEQLTMLSIVRGDALDPTMVALSSGSTAVYALVLFGAVVRLYGSERILSAGV